MRIARPVGLVVGDGVGEDVGDTVGEAVGEAVGLTVGALVGEGVGGAIVVVVVVVGIKQMFSTTTGSTGQQGVLPHCIDNSADNFVQMPVPGAPFTMSYLEIFQLNEMQASL